MPLLSFIIARIEEISPLKPLFEFKDMENHGTGVRCTLLAVYPTSPFPP